MKHKLKEKNNKKTTSPTMIFFVTIITSIVVISISISRYHETLAKQNKTDVAKWDITLDTDYNDYVLFENDQENEHNFKMTVKSESEVSSKYDIQINGFSKEYKVRLEKTDYEIYYQFNDENLNMEVNNNKIVFDISKEEQNVSVNESNYNMKKSKINGKTYISITNTTLNKEIVNFTIGNDNKIEVIYKNCAEYQDYGKHEDVYDLNISTDAEILPSECNIKVYALFEQID